MLQAKQFRVQNFKNINDSGWISLEQVTAFVGRNESGKTTLLKALHKFNPATPEPYDPQREFPRDRYTRDYIAKGKIGSDWPVCSVLFEMPDELRKEISLALDNDQECPVKVILTRYYDQSLVVEYIPELEDKPVIPDGTCSALSEFAKSARRIPAETPEQEEATKALRQTLADWASSWQDKLTPLDDLRNAEGIKSLTSLKSEANGKSSPQTADAVDALVGAIDVNIKNAQKQSVVGIANAIVEKSLPVMVYFENYGILDSAIWLPRFLDDLARSTSDGRVRTISAMFRHVGLDPKEITDLGADESLKSRLQGSQISPEALAQNQRQKEERAIRLNSASTDISNRFSAWWSQRRHKIRYHADGDYFRIWVADDRRPDVEIELEARSKGFQWFFSFYLLFLVESDDGHKDAILLLDEPGMHLHPTAQQELIGFFENLAQKNQLIYTTHSPFLIDGEHLYRVRPVTEDESGHSHITAETWPADRETIFPLQAAAGYAMVKGLFQNRNNLLVEGMTDFYYLKSLSEQCVSTGRKSFPDDIYITPCGGTKLVGHLASLFHGQGVCPLILLDGDDAGRVRRDALLKELYAGRSEAILSLDEALGRAGDDVEVEDIIGEGAILPALSKILDIKLELSENDKKAGSLPSQIKAMAKRKSIDLPDGWKATVAISLVSEWAERKQVLSDNILDLASSLFSAIRERFIQTSATTKS